MHNYQNFPLILTKHLNISTRSETFFKITDEKILSEVKGIKVIQFSFDFWEKIPLVYKGKNTKKMRRL